MGGSGFEINLSRRHALAALGTVGAASVGIGLGTSAFFSDQETFSNNRLVAGTLDMRVAYEEHYSDWSDDEDSGLEGSVEMVDAAMNSERIGLPTNETTPRNGTLISVANESDAGQFLNDTVDSTFPSGYDAATPPPEPCSTLPDGSSTPPAAIELSDIKPGDFGEVTFSFALCDNPGFVWMQGERTEAAEADPDSEATNVTEPEADDPDEDQLVNGTVKDPDPNAPGKTVELLESVRAAVWVDNGNNFQNSNENPVIVDSLGDVLDTAENRGIPLAGDIPAEQGGGQGRNCFSSSTVHNVVFAWWLPVDHANEIQTDYLSFDLGFYTEQCRHNDGRLEEGNWTQTAKVTGQQSTAGSYFGSSVGMSGSTLAVGADGDDTNGSDSGAVHILEYADGWSQTAKVSPSDGATEDYFGESVAVSSNTVVVGAPGDESGSGSNAGAAYVFERSDSGWTETKLTGGGAGASFGQSVAAAGDTVVVGADGVSRSGQDNAGAVYVFEATADGWTQVTTLTADGGNAQDYFGVRTALDSAGTRLAVSAYGDDQNGENAGSAYVFERNNGWTQTATLRATDGSSTDYFGSDIAIAEDAIVVGAFGVDEGGTDSGAAYVFEYEGETWTETAKLTASDGGSQDFFGWTTSIQGDTILVGAYREDAQAVDAGAAYVYERQNSAWSEVTKLTADDASQLDRFGVAGEVGENGIVVAATGDETNGSNSGAIYVFNS